MKSTHILNLFDRYLDIFKCNISLLVTFFLSFFFSLVICKGGHFAQNVASICYVVFLMTFLLINLAEIVKKSNLDLIRKRALCFIVLTHLGILCGYAFGQGTENMFWNVDSYEIHLPGAVNFANIFNGTEGLRSLTSSLDRIYFTHLIVGLFFYLFGVSPITSSLCLALIKLMSGVVIERLGRELANKKVGVIALLIFATAPTVLFYTLSYYKIAIVQLMLVTCCYFSFNFSRKPSFVSIASFIVCNLFLLNESVYLGLAVSSLLILQTLSSKLISRFAKALMLVVFFAFMVVTYLKYESYFSFNSVFDSLRSIKDQYNNYEDVNPRFNSQLPYFLQLLKLYLTPVFTFNKLDIFKDFSALLTWGSFFHQLIALAMAFVLIFLPKSFEKKDYFFLFPFLLFLLLFAYIAPYNGRLRDSFYPLIAIFAAPALIYFAERFIKRRELQEEVSLIMSPIFTLTSIVLGMFLIFAPSRQKSGEQRIFWEIDLKNFVYTGNKNFPFFIEDRKGFKQFVFSSKSVLQVMEYQPFTVHVLDNSYVHIPSVDLATGFMHEGNPMGAIYKKAEGISLILYDPGSAVPKATVATRNEIKNLAGVSVGKLIHLFYCEMTSPQCWTARIDNSGETEVKSVPVFSQNGFRVALVGNEMFLVGVQPGTQNPFLLTYDGIEFKKIPSPQVQVASQPSLGALDGKLFLLYPSKSTARLAYTVYEDGKWSDPIDMVNYTFDEVGELYVFKKGDDSQIIASMRKNSNDRVAIMVGRQFRYTEGLFARWKKNLFSL